MSVAWWEALLPPVTRAGSRTVLCDPVDHELALTLARHGYRLLLLHGGDYDATPLRQRLARSGLSSQLMGAHPFGPDRRAPVADFYDLWIFEGEPRLVEAARRWLRPGSLIVWSSAYAEPAGTEELRLPAQLGGLRT